jgi:anti-sigma regulatory factor (Ser/Thr protein kinase)
MPPLTPTFSPCNRPTAKLRTIDADLTTARPSHRGAPSSVRLVVPNDLSRMHSVRRVVESWLTAGERLPSDVVHDLLVVISELATNAMEASASNGTPIELTLRRDVDGLVVGVRDEGPGFEPPPPVLDLLVNTERGRGLMIVGAMMDDLWFERGDGVTIVSARLHIPRD